MLVFLKILLFPWFWLLFPTIFKNKKNIPQGKAIFICNHKSNADPILLIFSTWRKQYFLSKKELFENKFIKFIMKIDRGIPDDRGKTDLTAIKSGIKVLNDGNILTIFPEGTRNKTDAELSEVKAGAAMFAIKTKTPIVPIWIEKKPRVFRFNKVKFGEAFTLEEFYDQKLDSEKLDLASKIIAEKLIENK